MKEIINKAEATYGQDAKRTNAIKTIAWHKLSDAKKKTEARKIPVGKWLTSFTGKIHGWKDNPVNAFMMSQEKADAKDDKAKAKYAQKKAGEDTTFATALAAEKIAEAAGFKDAGLIPLPLHPLTNGGMQSLPQVPPKRKPR